MKIFKFGGVSTQDPENIKNVVSVINQTNEKQLVVVVSAMGKITNLLEKIVTEYLGDDNTKLHQLIIEFQTYHIQIINGLFENKNHSIYKSVKEVFKKLNYFIETNKSKNHAFVYDQIVSYGEFVSSTIISTYLTEAGIENILLDARSCIKTDATYREAKVDWEITQKNILAQVRPNSITLTQGFIGAERVNNFTTTLGREGSDYTAAIFAYCLNAESVTIWKDVPGVLNADPRYFKNPQLLNHISYHEAIELAFYGASVIHPKTLQPLQRKEIPLFVKSFKNPKDAGTCVGKGATLDPQVSCFILKGNQVLLSLSSLDFSFIMEDNISDVFRWLHEYKMKVNLIQNSAISFSVCVDNKYDNLEALLKKLREKFKVKWNENVTLYTVRHSKPSEIKLLTQDKQLLLKQESRETVQIVVKE